MSMGYVALVAAGFRKTIGRKVQANTTKHKDGPQAAAQAREEVGQEINALMRNAEIIDVKEDCRYGKSKRGIDLSDELRRRQVRLDRIRPARKQIEAETAAGAARQRQQESATARKAPERQGNLPPTEQAELKKKAKMAVAKAKDAKKKAIGDA